MNKEELQKILEQHELWLDSGGSKGKRAALQAAFLQNADLQRADLRDADLRRADLRYADLQKANLWRADLRYADLRRANLTEANLQDCYISYKEKPNVPFLLGNALVTEVCNSMNYWWRVKTWIELKPNEMEMAELLYG